ncbi:MAG: ligand-binding protein SH3 [Thermobacillus sp.]|uniref:DMT family transporter n=1 Tax=Thermobacillus sp. TaxID=2108467 RepID=UPI000E3A65F7|nr:multidrug efflux SMR transporter [Thermobacillus sp.]REK55429.1 MAG: ligand-binding protein SH3 [Thermobacillus sp.]
MAWFYVLIGGLLEIGWAYGMKESEGFTRPLPSAVTIFLLIVSFYFFAKSMTMLETGVAYAVYTGIGTAGTAIIGMMFLGESADPMRLLFLALLIGGIIGLKVISPEEPQNKKQTDEGGAG